MKETERLIEFITPKPKAKKNKAPSVATLKRWMNDGGCETPCGCWVEPDGYCEHGKPSWLLLMGLI